jgi:F0F1-type ATP synthase assembly protein I
MKSVALRARRVVMRVVLWQTGGALAVGALCWLAAGAAVAGAALVGGLIAAVGSGLFGVRMFAPGIAPAATLRRAMYAGEVLKWFWYAVAIWAALARLGLQPSGLVAGLITAQFSYWFGLVGSKERGT